MTDRTRQARSAVACALIAMPLLTTTALAAPADVTLRVEGKTQTLLETRVTTDGHDVTTQTSGTHKCDGTNGGANPTPGPTATAALDDATRQAGMTWDGTWFDAFEDFAIDRIGSDSADANAGDFWTFGQNLKESQVGGCQARVNDGDEVLWAYDGFGKPWLKLDTRLTAHTGETFAVTVTDGQDGSPEAGVSVGGAVTGADGRAMLTFPQRGIYRLKADKAETIRSATSVLCVDPPGSEPCTSTDTAAPTAQLLLPRLASETSDSRTFVVAWQANDGPTGSGVSGYTLDVRPPGGDWQQLLGKSAAVRKHFRGESGRSYEFRVSAYDRAGLRSGFASGTIAVPVDDRSRRRLRLRGWKRLKRSGAWGKTVVRSRRRGAVARMTFRGRRVALIGRKLRRGGRVRVTVDGRSKVLRLRGRPRHRSVLYTTAPRRAGRHTLRVTALGGGRVELDAVAPLG
jgi:hypothetical protein